jgi:hypothetical protein
VATHVVVYESNPLKLSRLYWLVKPILPLVRKSLHFCQTSNLPECHRVVDTFEAWRPAIGFSDGLGGTYLSITL